MPFNGSEGAPIPLADAVQLTANFRIHNPGAIKAHFFGKDIINQLLSPNTARGIRIYMGQDNNGVTKLVLVAADADERDIPSLVADFAIPCPHNCDDMSPLNGTVPTAGGQ